MKTTVQILEEARELLSDESRWTKGVVARLENGSPTIVKNKDAVCFCSLGAIDKVTGRGSIFQQRVAFSKLHEVVGNSISYFNDAPERKHSEVLEAFDKAIVLAKEQECS